MIGANNKFDLENTQEKCLYFLKYKFYDLYFVEKKPLAVCVVDSFILNVIYFHLQCNAAVGMKAFFDMMHEGPHKVMLFGAACTQVTDPIAKASKHWRITQVNNFIYFQRYSMKLSVTMCFFLF